MLSIQLVQKLCKQWNIRSPVRLSFLTEALHLLSRGVSQVARVTYWQQQRQQLKQDACAPVCGNICVQYRDESGAPFRDTLLGQVMQTCKAKRRLNNIVISSREPIYMLRRWHDSPLNGQEKLDPVE